MPEDTTFLCAYMTEEIIEVLDNQIHKSWKDSTVYNIARVVSGILSDYLEMKGQKDADKLTKFTINETKLPWRTADANDEESGCFLMMHMIAYEGEPYTSELGRKIKRRIFCAEMAAALVLADINEKRAEITKKVNSLTSGKEEIWNAIKCRRDVPNDKKDDKQKQMKTNEPVSIKPIATEVPVLRTSPRAKTLGTEELNGKRTKHEAKKVCYVRKGKK
ncbi:hypothetical protein RND81_13G047900 [Saponaria officinalis]|uniref:Uncharacterized protein n=1 Tax=Saponaria officinalis TaxID=3572 RepID=A0AAW1H463_SAPOF